MTNLTSRYGNRREASWAARRALQLCLTSHFPSLPACPLTDSPQPHL